MVDDSLQRSEPPQEISHSPSDAEQRSAPKRRPVITVFAKLELDGTIVPDGLRFRVDRGALTKAFRAPRLLGPGDKIKIRVAADSLTFFVQAKGIDCESRTQLLTSCAVPPGQGIVLETRTALFTDLLCNPKFVFSDDVVEFQTVDPSAENKAKRRKPKTYQDITGLGTCDITWSFKHAGTQTVDDNREANGRKVDPETISTAVSLVRAFAGGRKDSPVLRCVQISERNAKAGSAAVARIADVPDLGDVKFHVAQEHAAPLAGILRYLDRAETEMWQTKKHVGFHDREIRCVVPLESLAAKFDFLDKFACTDIATVSSGVLVSSLNKVLAQVKTKGGDRAPGRIRVKLEGGERATLRFEVPVGIGPAIVSCPVRRSLPDGMTGDFENHDFWTTTRQLAEVCAFSNSDEVELHFFEKFFAFFETSGGVAVRTYFAKGSP